MSKISNSFQNFILNYTRFLALMQEKDAQKRRSRFYDKLGQGMQPRQVEKPMVDSGMQAGLPVPQQPIAPAWNKPMTQGYGAGRMPFDTTTQQPSFRSAAQSAWQSDPQMGAEEGFTPFMMPEAVKLPVRWQRDPQKDYYEDGKLISAGIQPPPKAEIRHPGDQVYDPVTGTYSEVPGQRWQEREPKTPQSWMAVAEKPDEKTGNPNTGDYRKVLYERMPDGRIVHTWLDRVINPYILKATKVGGNKGTGGKIPDEQIKQFVRGVGGANAGTVMPPQITPTTTTRIEGWNPEWETDYILWLNGAPDDTINQTDFKTYKEQ